MSRSNDHSTKRAARILIILAAVLYAVSAPHASAQMAQQGKPPEPQKSEPQKPEAPKLAPIPDVEALDQDGKPIRFYSDLIKGKTVVVNFIFTSCTFVCPLQGQSFSKLQNALGARLGHEVSLVSVSIDPDTDTPARLKSWADKYGAKAGWTLVTGKRAEIDRLLRVMTGDAAGFKEHSAIAFIGNYDRGVWIRADSLDAPERLIKSLDDALRQKPGQ